MKDILVNVTIDKNILEFFEKKVKEEKKKGLGASRSAMVQKALEEFLFRHYGFQYMRRDK